MNGNTYSRINASCYSSFDNFVMMPQAFEIEEFKWKGNKRKCFQKIFKFIF